jgi:mRNA interferase MazF
VTAPIAGEVAIADLNPVVGNEQGAIRPVLVISDDLYNQLSINHVIIVPITSTRRGLPWHLEIGAEAGLHHTSYAMAEAVRAISTRRFGKTLGHARPETVAAVRGHVTAFLYGQV